MVGDSSVRAEDEMALPETVRCPMVHQMSVTSLMDAHVDFDLGLN